MNTTPPSPRRSRPGALALCVTLLWFGAGSAAAAVPVQESVPVPRSGQGSTAPADPAPSRQVRSGPQPGLPQPDWRGSDASGYDDSRSLQSAGPGQTGSGQGGAGGSGSALPEASRLAELFYQVQVLQQEVSDLRGLVEEQRFLLDRLTRSQQEQYIDLDRRMQELRSGGPATDATEGRRPPPRLPENAAGSVSAERPDRAASAGDDVPRTGGNARGDEREAYSQAFNLMKERRFEESTAAFNALVRDYPNGSYIVNAYYWLGELHLAQGDHEQARQAFVQVVNLYPDSQKVPDALYKLGVVHHRLGDPERAREYLNRVRDQHQGTSAAGLAQNYLAELQ